MMNRTFPGLVYFFIFFTFTVKFNAQAYTPKKIDSLQTIYSKKLYSEGHFKELITLHETLLKKSVEINYTKGEVAGYIELANFLCGMNRNLESFYYLRLAEKRLQDFNHPVLMLRLKIIYGRNYQALGLYNQAIENFNMAIKLAYQISNKEDRDNRLSFIYDWKRFTFIKMKQQDSADYMEKKCLAMPNPGFVIYLAVADKYIFRKKFDSAEYYINKSNNDINAENFEAKYMIMLSLGKLYLEKEEYDKALKFLMKSAEIADKTNLKQRSVDAYKLIATAYERLNDIQKQNEYLLKYTKLNDSLSQAEKNTLNIPIEKIVSDQDEENKKRLYIIILSIILLIAVIVITGIKRYKSKQKEKDILIRQKEMETHILRKKLDNSFEEIIQLAIEDNPLFIIRFKENYSEFYYNLTSNYPQLTPSDIKFCAFIKLKFSNKEIAEYGHMSVRTVESKKYRIRKKIDLDSEKDFNTWILNL